MRILLLVFAVALTLSGAATAQGFNYPLFNGTQPITLNAQAAQVGNSIRLAAAVLSSKGSMYNNTQLQVLNGFDTTFSFTMANGNGADGMAFVIHNDPRGASFIGDHGSSMGYGHFATAAPGVGVFNALVIELDTFSSSFNGFADLGNNEISVHTSGTAEANHGEDTSIGRVAPAVNLNDGAAHTVRVLYTPGTLDIFLDGSATPVLSVPYDFTTGGTHILPNTPVGGLNLPTGAAWIGISASCGGLFQDHDVNSWSFASAPVFPNDLSVSRLVAPANNQIDCSPLSNAETVTIDIRNNGMTAIPLGSAIQVTYQVDALPSVLDIFAPAAVMNSGDVVSFTFTTTADLSAIGNHTLMTSVSLIGDGDPSNDSLTTAISSGGLARITSFPFVEDFGSLSGNGSTQLPFGFINETTDATGPNSDWTLRNNGTPTAGTGPAADHTTGVVGTGGYAYIEDDGNYASVNFRTPCLDLTGLSNPVMRFFLFSENTTSQTISNQLSVDVISYPSGTTTLDVYGPQSETGTQWVLQSVDLSAFIGQVVQVVFRGETASVTSNSHDIAIDDITITDLLPTPGQMPQQGLAVLDMNGPRNVNGDPLQFNFGGPYFSTVNSGDTLVFRMEGQPNQSILMFTGPLNPVAATFPGVGSIDLGGAVDPFTGIPSALTIVGDGGGQGLFNQLFLTSATGEAEFGVTVPSLPPGVIGTFQCALLNTINGASLSNAVELSIF
ncbi:MAG: hypothetical protein ACI97A_000480 [Planctomycetota bacterium]|jgi:hypothetical protein